MLQFLPDDVLLEIVSQLSTLSKANFLRTSKKIWSLKSRPAFDVTEMMFHQEYFASFNRKEGLKRASFKGDVELVNFYINRGVVQWNYGLFGAIEGGHVDLVKFFLEKGASDWKGAICCAAGVGNQELMEMLLIRAGTMSTENLALAFPHAIEGGHLHIVEFLLHKGCSDFTAIWKAAEFGHLHIVKFFLEVPSARYPFSFTYFDSRPVSLSFALERAIAKGHREIANFLFERIAQVGSSQDDFADTFDSTFWKQNLTAAVNSGDSFMLQYVLEHWHEHLQSVATQKGFEATCEFLNTAMPAWNELMCAAIHANQVTIVEYCIAHGASDWNTGLTWSVQRGYRNLAELFISKGATNLNEAVKIAVQREDQGMKAYLISKGAVWEPKQPFFSLAQPTFVLDRNPKRQKK